MSSSSETGMNTQGIRGFSVKCACSRHVTIYTSKTQENPGRPFFSCPSKKDDHLFKWVEEAVYEEVEDNLPKFGIIESELTNVKAEVEELKALVQYLKEDGIRSNEQIRQCKMMCKTSFLCVCLSVIAIVYLLIAKGNEKKLVSGY